MNYLFPILFQDFTTKNSILFKVSLDLELYFDF